MPSTWLKLRSQDVFAMYVWEAFAHSVLLQAQSDSPIDAFSQVNTQEQLTGAVNLGWSLNGALAVDHRGPTFSAADRCALYMLAF